MSDKPDADVIGDDPMFYSPSPLTNYELEELLPGLGCGDVSMEQVFADAAKASEAAGGQPAPRLEGYDIERPTMAEVIQLSPTPVAHIDSPSPAQPLDLPPPSPPPPDAVSLSFDSSSSSSSSVSSEEVYTDLPPLQLEPKRARDYVDNADKEDAIQDARAAEQDSPGSLNEFISNKSPPSPGSGDDEAESEAKMTDEEDDDDDDDGDNMAITSLAKLSKPTGPVSPIVAAADKKKKKEVVGGAVAEPPADMRGVYLEPRFGLVFGERPCPKQVACLRRMLRTYADKLFCYPGCKQFISKAAEEARGTLLKPASNELRARTIEEASQFSNQAAFDAHKAAGCKKCQAYSGFPEIVHFHVTLAINIREWCAREGADDTAGISVFKRIHKAIAETGVQLTPNSSVLPPQRPRKRQAPPPEEGEDEDGEGEGGEGEDGPVKPKPKKRKATTVKLSLRPKKAPELLPNED